MSTYKRRDNIDESIREKKIKSFTLSHLVFGMFQAGLPLVARRASPVSALFAANKLELSQRPPAPGSGLKLKAGALRGAGGISRWRTDVKGWGFAGKRLRLPAPRCPPAVPHFLPPRAT